MSQVTYSEHADLERRLRKLEVKLSRPLSQSRVAEIVDSYMRSTKYTEPALMSRITMRRVLISAVTACHDALRADDDETYGTAFVDDTECRKCGGYEHVTDAAV